MQSRLKRPAAFPLRVVLMSFAAEMRRGRDFGPEKAGRSGKVGVGLLRPAQNAIGFLVSTPRRRSEPLRGTREMAAHPSPEPSPRCPVGISRRRGAVVIARVEGYVRKSELVCRDN